MNINLKKEKKKEKKEKNNHNKNNNFCPIRTILNAINNEHILLYVILIEYK